MSNMRHVGDQEVVHVVSAAVTAACEKLDEVFPGRDAGGITSNFQGLLEEVVLHMLVGRSLLDGRRRYSVKLPQLVIDDAFLGNPLIRGDLFLPVRGVKTGAVEALDPEHGGFKPLDGVGDAWTSFEDAAKETVEWLRRQGATLEEAMVMDVKIAAVQPIANKECGYVLVGEVE